LQPTKNYWAYKLSINSVSLIYDTGFRRCFGLFNRSEKFKSFTEEYNKLFNSQNTSKYFNSDVFRLKIENKVHNILPALYSDLMTVCSDLAKSTYKEYFGVEYHGADQLERIIDEINRLKEKIQILNKPTDKKDGVSFSETILLIEDSRGIEISRNIKLYEFKTMYDKELKKWQTH